MAAVWSWSAIERGLGGLDLLAAMEAAFVAYSDDRAVFPPVGELQLEDPPGDVHLKYGYLKGGTSYVVKIASGFYDNPRRGLPSSNGLMLLFDQQTGEPMAVLLDEGRLTDLRTAAAGAVAAKHLGPAEVRGIGIIGAGIQAREQLRALAAVTDCRRVWVWARRAEAAQAWAAARMGEGWEVTVAPTVEPLMASCNLVVTCTPATEPLVSVDLVRPGTHITAVGSDTADKQELDPRILGAAQVVVGDSLAQCATRGEIARAVRSGDLDASAAVELGAVIAGRQRGRTGPEDLTVVDLTGVAVQDLAIAEAVHRALVAAGGSHG